MGGFPALASPCQSYSNCPPLTCCQPITTEEEQAYQKDFPVGQITVAIAPPLQGENITPTLTAILKTYAEICTDSPEALWEWYLNNYATHPHVTIALERYGFTNPLLDLDGTVVNWAREVTNGAETEEQAFFLLVKASFEQISLLEAWDRKEELQLPLTPPQAHQLGIADCNEFSYYFYVAAKAIGLNVFIYATTKGLKMGAGGAHMSPIIQIGSTFYEVDLKTKRVLKLPVPFPVASAATIFSSYQIDRMTSSSSQGSEKDAQAALSLALDIDPNGEFTNFIAGTYFLTVRKDYAAAKTFLQKTLQTNPTNEIARIALSLVAAHEENFDLAKTYLYQARELNPQNPMPHYLLYDLFQKTGPSSEAENALQELIEINPMDMVAFSLLAGRYFEQRRYLDLERLVQPPEGDFAIDYFLINYYRGLAAFHAGKPEQAVPSLEAAFKESSGLTIQSSLRLGDLYLAQKDFKQAEYYFSLVAAIAPTLCFIYPKLQQVYAAQGSQAKASAMQKQFKTCESTRPADH